MTGGFDEVERNLDKLEAEMHRRAVATMDMIAHHLANDAKVNHDWGNPYSKGYVPTGDTDRSTVGGVYEETREYVRAALSAGMTYDVFLETAMQGRWAWLWRTVERNRNWIQNAVERGMSF